MVKVYENGDVFYDENKDYLLTNKYSEVFFRFDAPLLKETNKDEYALKVYDNNRCLLVLLKEPFNILLFGDSGLTDELVLFLAKNNYYIKDYLCDMELGEKLMSSFAKYGFNFKLSIGMDFMEAKEKVNVSNELIERANDDDLEEIYQLECAFIKDCGLSDVVDKDRVKEKLDSFRLIRMNGKIISLARVVESTKEDKKISLVYTRDEYRGKGYARIVVGSILNEIIDSGYIATLNVDQKNPISYHLYSSLGFKKIFSQGIFVLNK